MDPSAPVPVEMIQPIPQQQSQRNKFLELQQNSSRNKNNLIKPKTMQTFSRQVYPHEPIEGVPVEEMFAQEFDEAEFLERTLENVPLHWIDSEASLKEMYSKLKGEKIIAVDLEHHSFHSYVGLVSLIQISSSHEDFLVDPIRLRESLQSPELSLNCILADRNILKLFHGAESDIAWLQRDFDTFVVNMFDSFQAAKILNLPRMSLAYLLEQFCGVELDKKYQLADWRERPLSEEMIEYARKDTHYLHHLYHLLKSRLSYEQFAQVIERSNKQCLELYKPEIITEKSWKVVLDRSNLALNPEQVQTVRRLFYWREWKAKELDVSPPALMPNSYLAKIAHFRAKSVQELKESVRNISDLLSKELAALAEFLQGNESKESEVTGIQEEKVKNCENPVKEKEREHIRFEEEEISSKKTKIEIPAVPARSSRVSFVSSSAKKPVDIFENNSTSLNSKKILLAGLVQPLPTVELFKTREQEEAERAEQEKLAAAAEPESKETVEALIHGRNQVVKDLELECGGSNSTVLADKLRKSVTKKSIEPSAIIAAVDYKTVKQPQTESESVEAPEIFDPYNTIRVQKNSEAAPFIDARIAPATGPRLSATRMSGNRMASFTKKNKK